MELEHFFICPHCAERISVLLDVSEEHQEYIEDCEVCCRPMLLTIEARNGAIQSFGATEA